MKDHILFRILYLKYLRNNLTSTVIYTVSGFPGGYQSTNKYPFK